MPTLSSLEICTGAGGQALGLEWSGFEHAAVVEIDPAACETLRANRAAEWNVVEADIRNLAATSYRGVDLFAAGVPCPPFSIAGKQLGPEDERDLFPAALAIVEQAKPAAVLFENVPGLATAKFAQYRDRLQRRLYRLGFEFVDWQVLNACNFGVPQLRPRFILVALRGRAGRKFSWPDPGHAPQTVGETLVDLVGSRDWPGAARWKLRANGIAPTIVGGSKLHGGPDLGPTRAKRAWAQLSVDAMGIADSPPAREFPIDAMPKLTVRMAARVQGFPDSWIFSGRKTASYRQVGNAFPPPVARAVGTAIRAALLGSKKNQASSDFELTSL